MRATFPHRWLPWLLVAPQLAISLVFFYWPAIQALHQSVLREDPFGLSSRFVGLESLSDEAVRLQGQRQRMAVGR